MRKNKWIVVGLSNRIEIKIEDVSQTLPYPEECFDYVYARLVLHYLPKIALQSALKELFRVLRKSGKIFVVVRSTNCSEAQDKNARFDTHSGLTTYMSGENSYSRYFHSEESIQNYLIQRAFRLDIQVHTLSNCALTLKEKYHLSKLIV